MIIYLITYQNMFELLQYTALFNLRTGNIIIDTMLSSLIIYLISNLRIYTIKNKIVDIIDNFYNDNIHEITLSCTEFTNCYSSGSVRMNGSDAFKSVLYNILQNIKEDKVSNLRKLKEFCINKYDMIYDDKETNDQTQEILYLISQTDYFEILTKNAKDLKFQISKNDLEDNDDKINKNVKHKIYDLKIYSNKKNIKYIQSYINDCYKLYLEKLNEEMNNKQFIFVYENYDKTTKQLNFTTYPFDTTCNIDKIYFDDKDNLMKQIDFFKDNKEWYQKNGKPYTLGICSYGNPGCGKTSFEKSLAKYLNRHLIIVDLSKINNQYEADQIFFSEKINGKHISYDKRIYIFPDVDAMNSVVTQRKELIDNKNKNQQQDIYNFVKNMKENMNDFGINDIVSQINQHNIMIKPDDISKELNLSKFLNIIDGIPERTGQIIIFNTNYPDQLDDALLRPGRVDCLIHFQKMNADNMLTMILNFFELKETDKNDYDYISQNKKNIRDKLSTIERKWTPAELFQICSKYNDIHKILDYLLYDDKSK